MLRVTVIQKDPRPDGSVDEQLLARFVVDEEGVYAEQDDRTPVVMGIPTVDPSTGEQVTATHEPLRWAALLPTAFRSGTLEADIEEVEALDGTDLHRVRPSETSPARVEQVA